MNYVLIVKEYIGFETKQYNVACVREHDIEKLHEATKRFLEFAKGLGIVVQMRLETYDEIGAFVEYSRYDKDKDEFIVVSEDY